MYQKRTLSMYRLIFIGILGIAGAFISCTEKKHLAAATHFTREDSLTDRYLSLQDSMLQAWNIMINDDNHKLKSLHYLINELHTGQQLSADQKKSFEQRLEQLMRIRYTPKTMANPDVVEEYDFASSSIVSEIIALANSSPYFLENKTLQTLTEHITESDQRMLLYRSDYDMIAVRYNSFLQKHKDILALINQDSSLELRPLFNMLLDE
jgi:hypothetical protein